MIFGYAVDGDTIDYFKTKEEMLKNFENYSKTLCTKCYLTKEDVIEMTQFIVVFDTREELEKFF